MTWSEEDVVTARIRVALIGCVISTKILLEHLISMNGREVELVAMITRRGSSFNSDFVDLSPLALQAGIPLLFIEDVTDNKQQAEWLKKFNPDLIFCVGWSRLLDDDLMSIPGRGVIGFHPAALPANRGRHPLIWALVLGLTETASSFFMIDGGTDSGPIVSQKPVAILKSDTAATLYGRVLELIPEQINEIVSGVINGTIVLRPQDENKASYWRKRTEADGRIDWRMSAISIFNLVRALAHPYPGAHFLNSGQVVKVFRCVVENCNVSNAEPGKILAIDGQEVIVKCGDSAIRLLEHELEVLPNPGEYL